MDLSRRCLGKGPSVSDPADRTRANCAIHLLKFHIMNRGASRTEKQRSEIDHNTVSMDQLNHESESRALQSSSWPAGS